MSELSEKILIEKVIGKDHKAFALLMQRHRNRVYRTLVCILRNEEDALDVLQDTFIKVYQSIHQLKNPQFFSSWVQRIAVRLAINHLKKRDRQHKYVEKLMLQETDKHICVSEDHLEKQEASSILHKLIGKLPEKQRRVLVLCDLEDYSYREIAHILKCSIGTVMSRLFYARKNLRQSLLKLGYSDQNFSLAS